MPISEQNKPEGEENHRVQYRFLTPHQFAPLETFFDTMLVHVDNPYPLDIAAPHVASSLIGTSLAYGVLNRLGGRTSSLNLGASSQFWTPDTEHLSHLCRLVQHNVLFGCLICDRVLTSDVFFIQVAGTHWLLFDWWQWLRRRVEATRLPDVWQYLCHTNSEYTQSYERKRLGIDSSRSEAMFFEGMRLQDKLVQTICAHIQEMWGGDITHFNADASEMHA